MVQTTQPSAGLLATAVVAPPLRTVPLVFELDPEDYERELYDGANVVARPREDRVDVFQPGSSGEEVAFAAAAEKVAKYCHKPSSFGRRNGLLLDRGPRPISYARSRSSPG